MSDRSEALKRIARAAAREPLPEAARAGRELDHERIAGHTFRKGDRVVDPVTGQEGIVAESDYHVATVAAAGDGER